MPEQGLTRLARYPSAQSVMAAKMKVSAEARGANLCGRNQSTTRTGTMSRRANVSTLGAVSSGCGLLLLPAWL